MVLRVARIAPLMGFSLIGKKLASGRARLERKLPRSRDWLVGLRDLLLSLAGAMALHLAFVVLPAPAVGRIRTPDLDALLELFKFMGGMHWDRNEGWDPEGQTDPCNFDEHWFGVGCIDPCDIYRDGPDCKAGVDGAHAPQEQPSPARSTGRR